MNKKCSYLCHKAPKQWFFIIFRWLGEYLFRVDLGSIAASVAILLRPKFTEDLASSSLAPPERMIDSLVRLWPMEPVQFEAMKAVPALGPARFPKFQNLWAAHYPEWTATEHFLETGLLCLPMSWRGHLRLDFSTAKRLRRLQ